MHLVVWQAFERSGVKVRRVKAGKIMQVWNHNFAVVNQLKAAGLGRSRFTFSSEMRPPSPPYSNTSSMP